MIQSLVSIDNQVKKENFRRLNTVHTFQISLRDNELYRWTTLQ